MAAPTKQKPIISGSFWVKWADTHAPFHNDIASLKSPFKKNLTDFKKALEDAGAKVKINSTYRPEKRAYLFHWCWKIALGKCKPSDAKVLAGVHIQWDHGDLKSSKSGAMKMVAGFGLATPPKSNKAPSLTSMHTTGHAVDMKITWAGTINVKNKKGVPVPIKFNTNVDANTMLHKVGKTYGVIKLIGDKPHWSSTGR